MTDHHPLAVGTPGDYLEGPPEPIRMLSVEPTNIDDEDGETDESGSPVGTPSPSSKTRESAPMDGAGGDIATSLRELTVEEEGKVAGGTMDALEREGELEAAIARDEGRIDFLEEEEGGKEPNYASSEEMPDGATSPGKRYKNGDRAKRGVFPPPPITASNAPPFRSVSCSSFGNTASGYTSLSGSTRRSSTRRSKKRVQDPPARERPMDNNWPTRDALSFTRFLVFYGSGSITAEHEAACCKIQESRSMRSKYHGGGSINVSDDLEKVCREAGNGRDADGMVYRFGSNGVVELYKASDALELFRSSSEDAKKLAGQRSLVTVPGIEEFVTDYNRIVDLCNNGAVRSFSFQRLQMLTGAFKMHVTANGHTENEAQSNLLGTDFYRTMKIDNHIHLAAAASAKHFVEFVRRKLEEEGDTVVLEDGSTLRTVFDSAGLDTDHLTIDAFNVLADYSVYQRFDNFNTKYSPFRLAQMRKIFLKVENCMEGRYFAELTKSVLKRHEQGKGHNSAAEMRLSVYGMEREEWLNLAKWTLRDWEGGDHPGPVLSSHNRWVVQVPRLWRIYHNKGKKQKENGDKRKEGNRKARNFQEMLENLFRPMFEATLYPEKHPEVAQLLTHVVALDSVDDEGISEAPCSCIRPAEYVSEKNPAYCWQLYFLWANLEVLNKLRRARGLNIITFRPHAGETGDVMHLAATYMLAKSINHGINLHRQVSLQYLYYLDQVGLSISPLSNNFLFCKIANNPFPKFFKRGLNVTLSTDDPLLFHMSDDALLEEYSVARATFDLSMTDVSEIARNSVLQSDFEEDFKKMWLGEDYQRGTTHCDENRTHVPLIRAKFRAEHLAAEHMMVALTAAGQGEHVLKEMMEAFSGAREAHREILVRNFPDEMPSFPEQNQI